MRIGSRIHKEQKELSYLLPGTDPQGYVALGHALHEYFAYERRQAIRELNFKQGCNGLQRGMWSRKSLVCFRRLVDEKLATERVGKG